jgi:3-phenylpropionate/cinnamic acid dioxygenase small subunit
MVVPLPFGSLPCTVACVSIRSEVEQLLARYAELIDAGDFAGLGVLLSESAITTEDGTVIARGRDEIRALYEQTTRRHADGTPRTQHVITNVIVEPLTEAGVSPARVVARSRFTVLQATESIPLQVIVAGRYRDVLERSGAGGWVFVERCMCPDLLGNLGDHLLFDPGLLGGDPAE